MPEYICAGCGESITGYVDVEQNLGIYFHPTELNLAAGQLLPCTAVYLFRNPDWPLACHRMPLDRGAPELM